jgi:hypothetical protein
MKNSFSADQANQIVAIMKERSDLSPSPYEVKNVIVPNIQIDGEEKAQSGATLYLVTLPGDLGVRKLSLVKGAKHNPQGVYNLVECRAITNVMNPVTNVLAFPKGAPALRLTNVN